MKFFTCMLFFLSALSIVSAQQEIEIIKIKNEDKSVDISVANHSEISYTIKMNFELEGMKVAKEYPSEIEIKPGITKPITKLIATGPVTKYKIKYSATPENEVTMGYMIEEPNIVIYTKNNQKRSTQVRLYLEKHDYDFREFNASYDKKTKSIYQQMLKRRGLDPKEVDLPVIIYRGEIYYNVGNMEDFLVKTFPAKAKSKKQK